MKLLAVHIDQFGQFHQQYFLFPLESFVLLQGNNESGKTTLTRFIKYMLFGFPSRSILKANGLLSENEALIGGRIEFEHPDRGKGTLIRHLRKDNGKATILLENGEKDEESLLKKWFQGMDLALYEAVFNLDLDGLKDLHKLKPEELQHFLFSTGMLGNARILELEKKLEKETAERFRPLGKNPTMNQTLSELEATKEKLQSWDKKWDQYVLLKEEKEGLEKEAGKLEQAGKDQLEERQLFTEFKAIEPTLIRFDGVREALSQFSEELEDFPSNGRERYESWRTQMVTLEGEKTDLFQKIKETEEKLDKLKEQIDSQWLIEQSTIKKLVGETSNLDELQLEMGRVKERIDNERRSLQVLYDRLDMGKEFELTEQVVRFVDTGLQFKHELKSSLQELERMDQEIIFIQREMATLKQEMTALNQRSQESVDELSHSEREEALRLHDLFQREDLRRQELDWVETELKEIKKDQQQRHQLKKYALTLLVTACVLLVGALLGGIALFHHAWQWELSGSILFIVLLLFAGLRFLLSLSALSDKKMGDLKAKLQKLRSEQETLNTGKDLLERYLKSAKMGDEYESRKTMIERIDTNLQQRQDELEAVHSLRLKSESRLRKKLKEKGYPYDVELSLVLDLVELMEQAKQSVYNKATLSETLHQLSEEKKKMMDQLSLLNERMGSSFTFFDLKQLLEKLDQFEKEQDQLLQTLIVLKRQGQSFDERIARFQKECYNLWRQAHAQSEEDFYKKAALWTQRQDCFREKDDLYQTLLTVLHDEDRIEQFLTWSHDGTWSSFSPSMLNDRLQKNETSLDRVSVQLEELNLQLRQLEEDEQQAELIHHYEKLRQKFKQEASVWAVYKTAKSLLNETKETYKAKRLPKLIEHTQKYFHDITCGAYIGVYYQEADGFSIEGVEGSIFKLEELSRGTAEQLYVSIRLALVKMFELPVSLPLLVDDGFVNFDDLRLGQMLQVLQKISDERQVLLLTCHSYENVTMRMEEWKESGRKVGNFNG